MSVAICGTGWVTPLGNDVAGVWNKLMQGEEARAETITSPISSQTYQAFRAAETPATHPRLRRSSAISRFAVVAGLAALADAGLATGVNAERIALIFATSNGGVIYTKRFYHDIVATGAQTASPLLFPETVFNAPASHLAAIMGITGASYTLLGDGAVGILAVKMAEDLLQSEALDYCLVVAAEEIDWLLCDAYRKWRLLRGGPPIEPFHPSMKGMILGEGAGAVLIGRVGPIVIDKVSAGGNFARRKEAGALLQKIIEELAPADWLISSANGTFVDLAERSALRSLTTSPRVYTLKPALGESTGASALWQIVAGVQALRTRQLPPVLHATGKSQPPIPASKPAEEQPRHVMVLTCGLNQQAAGLRLSRSL